MTLPPHWPQQDTDIATALWKEGISAGEISKRLDYRYSRNAVLGRMHRLGLARSNPVKKNVKGRPAYNHDEAIRIRFEKGAVPADIAAAIKLPTRLVREALVKMGFNPDSNTPEKYDVHPMWGMEETERRNAFRRKLLKGVRETLNAL